MSCSHRRKSSFPGHVFQGLVLTARRLKLKRPQAAKKYRTELDELYAESLAAEEQAKSKAKAKL